MNYDKIKLNQLFREPDLHPDQFSEIELEDKMVHLKQEIYKKEPQLEWRKVLEEIVNTSLKLLETKLKDILERGWVKYNEVQKFLDGVEFSDEETFMIPLVEHTIFSEHHPKIEVRIGEFYVGAINFELQLQLVLSGIILKITDGKICGVKAGKCISQSVLSCEGVTLYEDEGFEFEF